MRSADSTMATRVYRLLLRLIAPPSFRAEFGEQTARLAADLVTQARRRGGNLAGVVAFGRTTDEEAADPDRLYFTTLTGLFGVADVTDPSSPSVTDFLRFDGEYS